MKKILTVLMLLSFLAACTSTPKEPATSPPKADMSETPATGIQIAPEKLATLKDVVCGMSVKPDAIADTALVDGRVYPFCNTECKKTFLADLNKYKIN